MAKVFIAQYRSGSCPECGDPIEQGEEVSYLDGSLLHAECNHRSFYGNPDPELYPDEMMDCL